MDGLDILNQFTFLYLYYTYKTISNIELVFHFLHCNARRHGIDRYLYSLHICTFIGIPYSILQTLDYSEISNESTQYGSFCFHFSRYSSEYSMYEYR